MRTLLKMTWLEMKLFLREPITVVFVFALPVVILLVLGEVFGTRAEPEVFRGVRPIDYYVPAYIGLVIASIGLMALPVHVAGYRDQGILRRFHASSAPVWMVLGAQVLVSLVLATLGGLLLVLVASIVYGVEFPRSAIGLVPAFLLSALSFASIGVLLGALLPTARAAQGAGLLLFFVMMMISGAGPPRDVMTAPMLRIGDALPLTHVIRLLQDPWLGFGWSLTALLAVAGFMVASAAISLRAFRWE